MDTIKETVTKIGMEELTLSCIVAGLFIKDLYKGCKLQYDNDKKITGKYYKNNTDKNIEKRKVENELCMAKKNVSKLLGKNIEINLDDIKKDVICKITENTLETSNKTAANKLEGTKISNLNEIREHEIKLEVKHVEKIDSTKQNGNNNNNSDDNNILGGENIKENNQPVIFLSLSSTSKFNLIKECGFSFQTQLNESVTDEQSATSEKASNEINKEHEGKHKKTKDVEDSTKYKEQVKVETLPSKKNGKINDICNNLKLNLPRDQTKTSFHEVMQNEIMTDKDLEQIPSKKLNNEVVNFPASSNWQFNSISRDKKVITDHTSEKNKYAQKELLCSYLPSIDELCEENLLTDNYNDVTDLEKKSNESLIKTKNFKNENNTETKNKDKIKEHERNSSTIVKEENNNNNIKITSENNSDTNKNEHLFLKDDKKENKFKNETMIESQNEYHNLKLENYLRHVSELEETVIESSTITKDETKNNFTNESELMSKETDNSSNLELNLNDIKTKTTFFKIMQYEKLTCSLGLEDDSEHISSMTFNNTLVTFPASSNWQFNEISKDKTDNLAENDSIREQLHLQLPTIHELVEENIQKNDNNSPTSGNWRFNEVSNDKVKTDYANENENLREELHLKLPLPNELAEEKTQKNDKNPSKSSNWKFNEISNDKVKTKYMSESGSLRDQLYLQLPPVDELAEEYLQKNDDDHTTSSNWKFNEISSDKKVNISYSQENNRYNLRDQLHPVLSPIDEVAEEYLLASDYDDDLEEKSNGTVTIKNSENENKTKIKIKDDMKEDKSNLPKMLMEENKMMETISEKSSDTEKNEFTFLDDDELESIFTNEIMIEAQKVYQSLKLENEKFETV